MKIDRLPPNTCPVIDSIIQEINAAIGYAAKPYNDLEEAENAMHDICWALGDLEDKLEKVRDANASLRSEAESAIEDVEILEKEIRSLEDDNCLLRDELRSLESIVYE